MAPKNPFQRARSRGSNRSAITAKIRVMPMPAAMPCTARQAISSPIVDAWPASAAPTTNKATPPSTNCLRPNWSDSRPAMGNSTVEPSR
jgi:hypothetical protein